ncbi:MAG TPA: ribonuclease HII [Chloroflexota bacterium]|nr:ribonuclease HII [Chloroflexota bacterium]
MPGRPRDIPQRSLLHSPDLCEEEALACRGFRRIAGLDEAGRGAWAGPVVAGAVCLPLDIPDLAAHLDGVRDSKQLSAPARTRLYHFILKWASDVSIGVVSPATIDRVGISRAGELAMLWAVDELSCRPDCLLIDAFYLRGCSLHQRPIIRGDNISLSIAAASIVAKVARDKLMRAASAAYPQYGFSLHKGYGTRLHQQAIHLHGPSPYHRWSFQPISLAGGLPL